MEKVGFAGFLSLAIQHRDLFQTFAVVADDGVVNAILDNPPLFASIVELNLPRLIVEPPLESVLHEPGSDAHKAYEWCFVFTFLYHKWIKYGNAKASVCIFC